MQCKLKLSLNSKNVGLFFLNFPQVNELRFV